MSKLHICHKVRDNIGGAPRIADLIVSAQVRAGYKVSVIALANISQRLKLFESTDEVVYLKSTSHIISAIKLGEKINILKPNIFISFIGIFSTNSYHFP